MGAEMEALQINETQDEQNFNLYVSYVNARREGYAHEQLIKRGFPESFKTLYEQSVPRYDH